mgnify:FL=1
MNLKVISRNVGFALLASAFFMFLSILVSIGNGNDSALAALLISFTLTFTVGIFPFIFVRKPLTISLKDGYMIIFLSWMLSFIFGMLPYVLWGGPFSVINALFETVSGYTTTGGTILTDVEVLPDSLLFWRSSTHFIGGLGVVVFLLLIIPSSSPMRLRLTNMEVSSLSREGYKSRTNKTVWIFAAVYLGLAVVSFLSYWAAGMSAFDAINHAFSVISTGGFSTKNLSIASFDSNLINILTIIFMFLSSVHFGLIYMVFATRSLRPLNNPVLKFYVLTILIASLLVALSLKMSSAGFTWGDSFMTGIFQVVSFISTTGFAISDNNTWPLFACFITVLVSIPCGMAGSTTGGVKSDRMFLIFKTIGQQIKNSIHPSSINQVHVGNHIMGSNEIYPHFVYFGLYFITIAASIVLTVLSGMDIQNAFASSVSFLSNVGPALEAQGTLGNYNAVPVFAKVVFIIDMFMGRVEIYPILAVVMMIFTGKKK